MQAMPLKTAASRTRVSIGARPAGWIVASAALALIILVRAAAAGPLLTIDPDRQLALAESLFAEKDFAGAVVEYRRFVHFFPEDLRADMAMYRIGRSYFNDRQYSRAIDAFFALTERFPQSSWAVPAYQGIAASHLQNNTPGQAVAVLEQLIVVTDDPAVIDDANYRIGWIYLETADWDRARNYWGRIRPENRTAYRVRQLSEELDKAGGIPKKDPATAGLLAVLPGAGHLYCGRYRDALIALVVNAALIAAAVESFNNDLPILGGVLTAVELGFYSGSIYSAVGSAHKYNRAQDRAFIEDLKKEARPTLSLGASAGGVAASVRIPF